MHFVARVFFKQLNSHHGWIHAETCWIDRWIFFYFIQAAAALFRPEPCGVPSNGDHPDPCAHSGAQLPADQAEPLQQPQHHPLRLTQVRH